MSHPPSGRRPRGRTGRGRPSGGPRSRACGRGIERAVELRKTSGARRHADACRVRTPRPIKVLRSHCPGATSALPRLIFVARSLTLTRNGGNCGNEFSEGKSSTPGIPAPGDMGILRGSGERSPVVGRATGRPACGPLPPDDPVAYLRGRFCRRSFRQYQGRLPPAVSYS
jgi:hypothetical protein